jgi:hypothetical protein
MHTGEQKSKLAVPDADVVWWVSTARPSGGKTVSWVVCKAQTELKGLYMLV